MPTVCMFFCFFALDLSLCLSIIIVTSKTAEQFLALFCFLQRCSRCASLMDIHINVRSRDANNHHRCAPMLGNKYKRSLKLFTKHNAKLLHFYYCHFALVFSCVSDCFGLTHFVVLFVRYFERCIAEWMCLYGRRNVYAAYVGRQSFNHRSSS